MNNIETAKGEIAKDGILIPIPWDSDLGVDVFLAALGLQELGIVTFAPGVELFAG